MTKRKVPKFMILKPARVHRVPVLSVEKSEGCGEDLSEKTDSEWTRNKEDKSTSIVDMNSFAMFWDREKTPQSGHSAAIAEDIKKESEPTEVEDSDVIDAEVFEE